MVGKWRLNELYDPVAFFFFFLMRYKILPPFELFSR